eukprot:TCONS_00025648-protein
MSYHQLRSDDPDNMSEMTEQTSFINPADAIANQLSKNIALDIGSKWKDYNSNRRIEKHKVDSHRKGPAPIEEADGMKKGVTKATYGTLDSDVEELEFDDIDTRQNAASDSNPYNKVKPKTNAKGDSLASCRALIVYFSKLAKSRDDDETIDMNFVDSLLQNGADINFSDKHGQTVMHEISRAWHPDVAKFAIQHGADVNKADKHGRSALHLAAAVDYDDMIEFLVHNGANLGAKTVGENQTPMHYAAKNNAAASLKMMLRLGAHINDRDYKKRTPLFVAAETARAEAARFLIEQGAPAGVYDSSGTSCLALMIEKMPHVAIEAAEQFHLLDRAFRKHYYYLSYIEPDPLFLLPPIPTSKRERREQKENQKEEKRLMKEQGKKAKKREKTYAKTPLEVIVQFNQLDMVMHPVFQRLLHVKWGLFGKFGSLINVSINLVYTLIWTFLGIFLPKDHVYYTPMSSMWWRLVLELIAVSLTCYFIYMEISQLRITEKVHNRWRQWRTRHVEKDLQYCHERWPEEKKYLESELAQIRTFQRTYFREPWNIFEWIAYFVVLTLVLTRILAVAMNDRVAESIHPRIYSLGLIVIWLRFMRACRAFRSLGPFICILGSVIEDTMKFAFLFFEFFIPYTVGFWIIFGGPENPGTDWTEFNDLIYSVWGMTLMGDFDWEGLIKKDRLMAQILCGTYFALAGVVCMNLYIALLSDTFARVYAQAQANAVMQQAKTVILLEGKLEKEKKLKFGHYLQDECSPEEVYSRDEGNSPDDHDNDMFEKVTRQITNRIDELEDNMKRSGQMLSDGRHGGPGGGGGGPGGPGSPGADGGVSSLVNHQTGQIDDVKYELSELKNLMHKMMSLPPPSNKEPSEIPPKGLVVSLDPIYPPAHPLPGYQQQPPPNPYPPQTNNPYPPPPSMGYMPPPNYATDAEADRGKGPRRRGRRGKKGPGSGYDSDSNSFYSEQVPVQHHQRPPPHHQQQQRRPRSPSSVQSAPISKKNRRKKKNLGGSWEDIRADINT